VRRLHDSVGVIGVAETTSHVVRLLYHNISIVLGGLRDISFHLSRGNPNPTSHTSSTENFVKPFNTYSGRDDPEPHFYRFDIYVIFTIQSTVSRNATRDRKLREAHCSIMHGISDYAFLYSRTVSMLL